MASTSRQKTLLALLLAALGGVLVYQFGLGGAPATPRRTSQTTAAPARPGTPAPPAPAPDVRLSALDDDRPELESSERNPFQFRARQAPAPPPRPGGAVNPVAPTGGPVAMGPLTPSGPPPPPPIPFKFIGIVEGAPQGGKLAVLSDGRIVVHGREGAVIEGRYKILHIGVESIEMAYLDGRGRQTIRLTGS